MSPCMLVFTSICFWQILPFILASVDDSVPADQTTLSDVDIKLQLNYITRLLNRLEEENVALKAANAALKTEDARLNKRLSNLEDDHHELMMKNVKIIKEFSNTLKEKTKTVVPVNKELNNISSTFTDKHKSRGQKRLLVPADVGSSPVAFTAVLTHIEYLGPLQTLEYDKVITNIGNAYDSRHGHFTAPVKGIYMLSATICDQDQIIRIEMVKNGVQLVAMYGDDGLLASHTIMVSLEQNDMVWVRHFNEGTSIAYSRPDRYYTSFAGALIAALQ